MANKVTIDVEARFIDNVTSEAKDAAKSLQKVEKAAEEVKKDVDSLGKSKAQPKVDADTSKAMKKLDAMDRKLSKLDKINDIAVRIKDSAVLKSLNQMSGNLKSLTKKAWNVAVKIKDTFTAPLTKLKNMLFNVKTLIAGIASAWAATKLIAAPINLADAYSSAKIGFSTLLGESRGQKMMDDLDAFAKRTPFKTSGVISNAQKMMAMGWDVETILEDMEVIGNAAAATGKMDQGLESIVRALSQIKTKGKLSTEELNQLAEAGISAKAMLAENLGYGTGDEGIAKMTKDLESGAIASNVAIEALLTGMRKYDGMMDSMANETVEGLWSQIQDAFEISVFRKWGQGLQDGAKRGFGTLAELLDSAEEALGKFGDTLYEIGKTASNWVADKFQGAVDKIMEITGTFEFENASLKEKISMLWRGVVADPLQEWWDNGGQQKTAETAGKIGSWMGKMLTKGLLAIFGATDVLNEGVGVEAGSSIAGSFLDGFLDNFNGQAITDAFANAISNVWGALPAWAKILIGGYGVGKVAGGISNLAGGITKLIGGVGSATKMTGLLGYGTTAAISLGAGNLAGGASLGAGALSALGLGATAGGLIGGASLIKGGLDLYSGYHSNDITEAKALKTSGKIGIGSTLAGAGIGATIGSVIPGLGTLVGGLIGAGIGGIAGWIGGEKTADKIRAARYESEAMQAAIKDSEKSAEELAQELAKAKWENAREHFGDIKLTLTEIERIADQIIWGDDLGAFEQFSSSAQAAEASLQGMKDSAEQINRWTWKAGLGLKFNEDEMEAIVASYNDYVNSAKSLAENKHYEFTSAVGLLLGAGSDKGAGILGSGDAFYGAIQEQLNDLGSQLTGKVSIALEDGVITLDEQAEISSLQQQIAEITEKLANAEQQAELDLIKLKFGKGNLDYESFENFMSQMQTTIDERMEAGDKAFVASVSSLKLQLADGAISQEEYDTQLQTIVDGYTGTVDSLQAEVKDVELSIIGNAYASKLGTDAAADLRNALDYAISYQMDPIELSDETMARLINIDLDGNGETISNIKDMLSSVFEQTEALDVSEVLTITANSAQIETGEDFVASVTNSMEEQIQDVVVEDVTIKVNDAKLEVLKEMTTDELAAEFGISEPQAQTIYWMLKGDATFEEIEITAAKFGIQDSYLFNPTITINPNVHTMSKTLSISLLDGAGYRGGIFGGSFARGGEVDNSGIVGGSTRFIRVNEEAPEMVLPLSSQRRGRALKLWAQAGNIMGVPGFARGGIIGGNSQDEGIRFNTYGSSSSAEGGRAVQVDVGGVTLEINVNGSDREGVVEAIKAQAGDLADYFVGIIAEALETEFENTPVRGGVA